MRLAEADVRRAAAFARLTLAPGRAAELAAELAPLAALLEPLSRVRPEPAGGAVGVGAGGMPLRADAGPPYDLARPAREVAPAARAGYVLVPRLAAADEPPPAARGAGPPADDPVGDDALAAELELGA